MTYALRHDVFTMTEHYWIRWWHGTFQVRRATPDWEEDNETVFEGHYEDCVAYIEEIRVADLESRF